MAQSVSSDEEDVWSEEATSPGSYVKINTRRKHHQSVVGKDIASTEMHTFSAKLPDWSNVRVLHRNTLPPRSSFFIYDTVHDALTRDITKSKTLSLSGTWKLKLAEGPFDAPAGFQEPHYDHGQWDEIKVPGMWQLQGHGKGPQ